MKKNRVLLLLSCCKKSEWVLVFLPFSNCILQECNGFLKLALVFISPMTFSKLISRIPLLSKLWSQVGLIKLCRCVQCWPKKTAQFCKYLRNWNFFVKICAQTNRKCACELVESVHLHLCLFHACSASFWKYLCNRSSDLYQIWNLRSWHSSEQSIEFL